MIYGNIVLLFMLITTIVADLPPLGLPTKNDKKSIKFPACKSCTLLTDSFKKGIDKTARNKHDGGDAAWEEQKLGAYKKSEVRLVEIQESLCNDLQIGDEQCHSLAENNEHLIEEWWFKHQDDIGIHQWLCVDQTKVCCPPNTYGPDCTECPNCNGNGLCKGNGTRKGSGQCLCETGYDGDFCNKCSLEYFESFRDDQKLLCSPCHRSCANGGCTVAGPKGCRICKIGWNMNSEMGGCVDIDECALSKHSCTKNQFCVNTDGWYSCLECDRSCNGCTGDGPDLCNECKDGYELTDGYCKDFSNEKRSAYVTYTRYLTYLGLCVATYVIFQNSTTIASIIGLAVAIYVTLSEYWLNSNTQASLFTTQSSNDQKAFEYSIKD